MASIQIVERKGKKRISYNVRVKSFVKGKIFESESKTFKEKKLAVKWGEMTKEKLEKRRTDQEIGVYRPPVVYEEVKVGQLIRMYLEHPKIKDNLGRTKVYVLNALLSYPISNIIVSNLRSEDLIDHCRRREAEPSKPSPTTIYHDITYLKSVIDTAKGTFQINASSQYHTDALPVLINEKLIGRSVVRDRRPTKEEIELMSKGLKKRQADRNSTIPFSDIFEMSLLTAMRVGEITKIRWEDLDIENSTVIIRNRKDPRNKQGNDSEIPLLNGALDIILRQEKSADKEKAKLIFPYNERSISAGWQRVRNELGIKDLSYHDLRREAASRLAEAGMPIHILSKITGHKNINILNNIYTKIDIKKMGREWQEKYPVDKS